MITLQVLLLKSLINPSSQLCLFPRRRGSIFYHERSQKERAWCSAAVNCPPCVFQGGSGALVRPSPCLGAVFAPTLPTPGAGGTRQEQSQTFEHPLSPQTHQLIPDRWLDQLPRAREGRQAGRETLPKPTPVLSTPALPEQACALSSPPFGAL